MNRILLPCRLAVALACAASPVLLHADEGMWTFDRLPAAALASRYNVTLPSPVLDRLRNAAVRVGGGSGAFVSSEGLVLTNHHVARGCVQRLSSALDDLAERGYQAHGRAGERPCPGAEARQLDSTLDVTDRVRSAVRADDPAAANAQRIAAITALESECSRDTGLRCEVVTLYRGAMYQLYRYHVWTDVRLVFVPEQRVAAFGGDTDNFTYPRFDLDFALLRVYDKGVPLKPPAYLPLSRSGVGDGDLVFIAGYPGSTERAATVDQLVFERDVRLPFLMGYVERQLTALRAYEATSPESARRAADAILGSENFLKSMRGQYRALKNPALLDAKRKDEARLQAAFARSGDAPDPWVTTRTAMSKAGTLLPPELLTGYGFNTLYSMAGILVELPAEAGLPASERLDAYRPSAVPRLKLRVTADEPFYKDLEIVQIASLWQQAHDTLGANHPYVRRVLGGKSPLDAARAVVEGTKLDQLSERKRLLDGGAKAIAESTDPMIVLVRDVYPMHRSITKASEVEVRTPTLAAGDALERLRFAVDGANAYPDATFTLRLSYGVVRGYDADGMLMPWATNFWGLYGRNAAFGGRPPFDLPPRWREKARALDLATPLNFVATLDIIGGNSGSPIVDRRGELVGLAFDTNLEALGGRFAYTDDKARAIAVDVRAIVEALAKVYDAGDVARELTSH
jgi:hypothetical protein